jgi:peptidyl-prolyl cis-trans isomerase D
MLSLLRRGGFVQFVMAAIVMVIILAFAFDYRGGSTSLKQECVVRLAGDCIPPKDFFSAFRLAVPSQLEPEQVRAQGLRQQVVDGLIERELLLREARKLGVGVSEEEVDKVLATGRVHYSMPAARYTLAMSRRYELEPNDMVTYIPVKNAAKDFDFKVYKRSVQNFARMSTKDFKERQQDELVAARMRSLIQAQVRVSENEAFAQFTREGNKAVARIAQVPRDWFLRFTVSVSKEREQQFATANTPMIDAAWETEKAAYVAGCADISEIVIDIGSLSDEEKAQAKKKLEDAKAKISSADDFAAFASALSSSPSAAHGGRVGCVAASDEPDAQAVQEAVKALSVNQVSAVLSSDSTLRLVRLNASLPETDLTTVGRQLITSRLTREAVANEQAEQFAKQVLELAKTGTGLEQAISQQIGVTLSAVNSGRHKDALHKAASESELRPKMEVSSSFSIGANPLPGALGPSPAPQLFALQKPDELLPTPVATEQGWAVLQLKEKTAVTREEFTEKKSQLMRELQVRKQADALVSYIKRLRDAMQSQIQIDARYVNEDTKMNEDG